MDMTIGVSHGVRELLLNYCAVATAKIASVFASLFGCTSLRLVFTSPITFLVYPTYTKSILYAYYVYLVYER